MHFSVTDLIVSNACIWYVPQYAIFFIGRLHTVFFSTYLQIQADSWKYAHTRRFKGIVCGEAKYSCYMVLTRCPVAAEILLTLAFSQSFPEWRVDSLRYNTLSEVYGCRSCLKIMLLLEDKIYIKYII